ncbi:hypothetical protein BN2475_40026 [Paraburkholderia ribeironis]|uniref:Uncharacterized protein n=1 Tax=Paraburkholderia ribeironis TaxID=1247936 RepID=A0A1N7RJ72_9BURK|nr:hypothetical protein BN2475_40026 [Paraburkholderia ribeironis]
MACANHDMKPAFANLRGHSGRHAGGNLLAGLSHLALAIDPHWLNRSLAQVCVGCR